MPLSYVGSVTVTIFHLISVFECNRFFFSLLHVTSSLPSAQIYVIVLYGESIFHVTSGLLPLFIFIWRQKGSDASLKACRITHVPEEFQVAVSVWGDMPLQLSRL